MSAPDNDGAEALQQFERALVELDAARYDLTLFVAGASALSARAIANVRTICDKHLCGRYELKVIDVYRDPTLVSSRGVLALPTLVKEHPLPKRVLVGDLSEVNRVLLALDIEPVAHSAGGPA